MNKRTIVLTIALLALSVGGTVAFAAIPPIALNVGNFAILGSSTVTNTGSSVINGDVGVSAGTVIDGFPPGVIVGGSKHSNDTQAQQAQVGLTGAYSTAAGQTPVSTIGTQLGTTVLTSGVYKSGSGDFDISGPLTLDAQNDPNAVFIFQTTTTLVTGSASSVVLVNGAQACNVFWQVGSSATLGTNSSFKGIILAQDSVTLTTGANVEGRALARTGAVTLDTNVVTVPLCNVVAPAAPTVMPVVQNSRGVSGQFASGSAFTTQNSTPATSTITVTTTSGGVSTTTGNTSSVAPSPVTSVSTTSSTTVSITPAFPNTGLPPNTSEQPLLGIVLEVTVLLGTGYVLHKKYGAAF